MLEKKEFKVESSELTFRIGDISPVEIISLRAVLDFDDLKKTTNVFNFILEHIEVNVAGVWCKVKEENREIYTPVGIENEFLVLNDISKWFIKEIIMKFFTQSNRSNQDAI